MSEQDLDSDRSATRFFILVFGTTWLFQLPALLAERGVIAGPVERYMPLVVLGFFGPTLFALVLSAAHGGRRSVAALCKPLAKWRVGLGWYLLAVCFPGAIFIVARVLLAPFGGDLGPWVFPPSLPQHFAAMVFVPLMEQIPWRGYVYPRLERASGSLPASLVTGVGWSLFHVQKHAFIDPNVSLALVALTIAFMTAGTVVFSWIYLRTGGSMLLIAVVHAATYLNNPAYALPNLTPLAIDTAGFCLAAVAAVVFDRTCWRTPEPSLRAAPFNSRA